MKLYPYESFELSFDLVLQTIVLSDHDYVNNISIQKQLVGKDMPYDITSSQMVLTKLFTSYS